MMSFWTPRTSCSKPGHLDDEVLTRCENDHRVEGRGRGSGVMVCENLKCDGGASWNSPRHGRACPGHPRLSCCRCAVRAWMPGPRPGMTHSPPSWPGLPRPSTPFVLPVRSEVV